MRFPTGMRPIKTSRTRSDSSVCLRPEQDATEKHNSRLPDLSSMKFRTGIIFLAVSLGLADGDPYVTDWWRRGVATVKNFVLGAAPAPWHQQTAWQIAFDPDAGLRKAPDYQRYFGPRGERLVQLLGSGGYDSNNQKAGGNRRSSPITSGQKF